MTTKRNKPIGAPTKLTPALQKKFVEQVKLGNYFKPVRGYCGITYTTFRDWMCRGEEDAKLGKVTIYSDFSDAVTVAEAEAEIFIVGKWREAIEARLKLLNKDPEKVDLRIFKDFLASRYNDRWGRNVTQTSINGKLDIDVKKLSNEELQEIVDGKLRRSQ